MKFISRINGPVVKAKGDDDFSVQDMVYVGKIRLIGEVISVDRDEATIQVYESTSGLMPGEPVETTGQPLSVYLAPGIIGNMFDGIQRPLEKLYEASGDFITRGQQFDNLDTEKKWHFIPVLQEGAKVSALSIFGEIPETGSVRHRVMIPMPLSGIASAADGVLEYVAPEGDYTITDCIAKVRGEKGDLREIQMLSRWPVRIPRPYAKRIGADEPLITGQRVIDTLFPLARGGTAAIPGSFGTGKTMTQHQLAQWCDADIIVYIGCGERGNEMTEVLEDFPGLKDPRNGRSLMERTVLIANTSNMPVAAREASIYTGITLAEYYRDMGLQSWLTPRQGGRKHSVKYQGDWKKCRQKKVSRHIYRRDFQNSTAGQDGLSAIMIQKAASLLLGQFLRRVAIFQSLLRRIQNVLYVASGAWIGNWPMHGIIRRSTG